MCHDLLSWRVATETMKSMTQTAFTRDTYCEGQSNFFRIFSGILNVIVPSLRQIFSKRIQHSYLLEFIKKNKDGWVSGLLRKRHIRLDKYAFPDYDFNLLYSIFREIQIQDLAPPTHGWGKPPELCNVTFGDDLERIRSLKNRISHSTTPFMSKGEFEVKWDMLYSVTQRNDLLLKDSKSFTEMLQKLGTESLCHDTYKELEQTLKEWREEDTEVKNLIQDFCLFHQPEPITASTMKEIRENFAHTSAADHALQMLQRENLLVIVGLNGDGKTGLGMYLMAHVTDRICLKINFQNIDTLSLLPNKKYGIFIDDCFYDIATINMHSSLLYSLLPKVKDGTFKIIIACTPSRFQLCSANKFFSHYLESDCVVYISRNGKNLAVDDKIKILQSQKLMGEELEKLPIPFGFLKCIQLYKTKQTYQQKRCFKAIAINYFFDIFNNMYFFREPCFLVLLKVFQYKAISRQITPWSSIQQGSSAIVIDKAIEELVSEGILRMENAKFSFTYPSLFEEAMAKLLALKYPEMFIRSCPLRFLKWINIENDQNCQHYRNEPQFCAGHMEIIFERIKKELETKDRSVFEIISFLPVLEQLPRIHIQSIKGMTDKENTTLLHHVTRASRFNALSVMLNGLQYEDVYNTLKELLLEASINGNKRMLEFILYQKVNLLDPKTIRPEMLYRRKADTEKTSQSLRLCECQEDMSSYLASIRDKEDNNLLMIAAKSGNRDLVEFIYRINLTLIDQRNSRDETTLHAAATANNLAVLKFVLQVLPANEILTRNNEGNTALHFAAELGGTTIIEYLANTFPDDFVQQYNDNGMAPLHICIIHSNVDVLMHLKQIIDVTKKTKTKETGLHLAARNRKRKDELAQVMELFDNQNIIEEKDDKLKTVLHAAAESGTSEVFKHLLDVGCAINSITDTGDTVFHLAVSNANSEVLEFLLHSCSKYPQVPFERNNLGFTPLHSSASFNVIDIFIRLIDAGYPIKSVTNSEQTVLHLASINGCLDIVNHILDNFEYLTDLRDSFGLNALHSASIGGHIPIFKLLQSKISLTATTNTGKTVLHLAVENNHQNLVECILQSCDKNKFRFTHSKDKDGMTVLNIAAKKGLIDMFKMLKANVFARQDLKYFTVESRTILLMAIEPGNASMVRYLLTLDGVKDVIKQTTEGKSTALHQAACSGDVEVYKALEKEFSVKAVTSSGSTVLHLAATNGNLEMIKYICTRKHGTELFKVRDKKYRSPFLLALRSGYLDVIEELMKQIGHICLSDRDDEGSGCIHYATRSGKSAVINFLLRKDPDAINRRSRNGFTALFNAIEIDSMVVYNFLENRCTSRHFIATESCNTVLHYAAKIGNVRFVKHILETRSELRHTRNSLGKSCMHVASESGQVDIVKLLLDRGHVPDNLTDSGDNILDLAMYQKKHEMQSYIRTRFRK